VPAQLRRDPGKVRGPDAVRRIERPEATGVESAVRPARLANPHHLARRSGVESPAALATAAAADLGQILPDAPIHALIVSGLRRIVKAAR
jgi:hypothetical protein